MVLLLLLLQGCSLLGGNHRELTDLDTARRVWDAQGLHDYDFTLNRSCYCGLYSPHRLEVRADTIKSAIRLENGEAIADSELKSFDTIEALFLVIEQAVDRADALTVEYNLALGYPTRIDIDYIKNAVDDEILYQVSDVTPLDR